MKNPIPSAINKRCVRLTFKSGNMHFPVKGTRFSPLVLEFDEIESTQDACFEILSQKKTSSCAVLAQMQKKGRGRFNREWFSPRGGLWASLGVRIPQEKIAEYAFAIEPKYFLIISAISCAKVLERETGLFFSIRLPNDILFQGKKICGILIELKKEIIVCGFGVNINIEFFPDEIKNTATSLFIETGSTFDIRKIFVSLIEEFFLNTESFLKERIPLNEFKHRVSSFEKKVSFTYKNKRYNSLLLKDMDSACNLIFENNLTVPFFEIVDFNENESSLY